MARYNNLEGGGRTLCGGVGALDKQRVYRNLCVLSVIFGFSLGLLLGILVPLVYLSSSTNTTATAATSVAAIKTVFLSNSHGRRNSTNVHPTVSFVNLRQARRYHRTDDSLITDGIYWGARVEDALPRGYAPAENAAWSRHVLKGAAVKLEIGCGRMQNRLVTFGDGTRGCVRYRQNTDQIQGELFSFYLAQVLELPNLAPSTVAVVDLQSRLWRNLAGEIAAAQWNSNRPVVLTEYIADLDAAAIPGVFKPTERHLDGRDVRNMTVDELVELAQWSDLIVFDYLTANLDRVVNNLYNYQWNVNIMDAPAHNLARKHDTDLLVFLDNESGLLHGYRLLQKYEVYHALLLDNLCVFRRKTADAIRRLWTRKDVGTLLRNMYEDHASAQVKDVLPTLPDRSIKILNQRIGKVHDQVLKCETKYSRSDGDDR